MQSTFQPSMAKRYFAYLEKYLSIFNLLPWVWNWCETIRENIFFIITEHNNEIAHILCGVPTPMHVKVKINLNMCYMKSTSLTILKKLKDDCKCYFKRHYDQQINWNIEFNVWMLY